LQIDFSFQCAAVAGWDIPRRRFVLPIGGVGRVSHRLRKSPSSLSFKLRRSIASRTLPPASISRFVVTAWFPSFRISPICGRPVALLEVFLVACVTPPGPEYAVIEEA
jgi:hypothetical protein